MSIKFVAEEGLLKGLTLDFDAGSSWTIGRDPDNCNVVVEDPEAERQHARCEKTPQGIILQNLATEKPVEINGIPIKEPHLLKQGDKVKIGSTVFHFYAEEEISPSQEEGEGITTKGGEGAMSDSEVDRSHLGSLAGGEEEKNLEAAEELLDTEIDDRIEHPDHEPHEESESLDSQDDNIASKEHSVEAEKNSSPPNNQSGIIQENMNIPEKEEMDTIFHDDNKDNKDFLAEVNFDLLETGRWLLKVVGGPNTGAEFSMQAASSYLIGTDPNTCDIVFHDTSVSRQHARITISDEDTLILEDLKSRNGTMVDGKRIEGRTALEPNIVISVGTTSFVIFDREGEMQTIISPMLPSIVKVLQQEEAKEEKAAAATPAPQTQADVAPVPAAVQKELEEKPHHKTTVMGAFVLIALVTGLFVIVGMGTLALFRGEPVALQEPINITSSLGEAISPYKDNVTYSYNQNQGRILLVGHVLTSGDKSQLIDRLQGLPFVKSIDDKGIIVDEYVLREINPILSRNKAWRGVTIQAPKPGVYVLSGNLHTRDQAEQLSEYISSNFPFLDNIERRVIIEEEVINSVETMLQRVGIREVQVKMNSNELTLTGGLPAGKEAEFNQVVEEAKSIQGIRNVRSFVTELPAEATLINISDRYKVSGAANQGGINLTVVINGRVLSRGESLDGMTITSIKPNVIFLEKDGIKYRIDY